MSQRPNRTTFPLSLFSFTFLGVIVLALSAAIPVRAAGLLDTTFGVNGRASGPGTFVMRAAAIQPEVKIVLNADCC
jgi:hypothetical protein